MSKTYTVPPPPHHNEGKTVAAWTMNMGIVIGSVPIAAGLILHPTTVQFVKLIGTTHAREKVRCASNSLRRVLQLITPIGLSCSPILLAFRGLVLGHPAR